MKNIFEVTKAEKDRIRKLHENYSILDECGESYGEELAPEERLDQVEDEISFLMDSKNEDLLEMEEDDVIEMEEGDDYEEELPENNRNLGGGDETKGGLPKQRGSKPSAMKKKPY
jgi:hypothetical protein|tara:strand:+ start:2185 stop:2529 length:345 start_codon:yes stop_codon:yes gene_type:complete